MQMASHPVWSFARYSYALKLLGYTARRNDVLNPYHDFTGTVNREILERFDYNSNRNRFDIYSENLRSMIAICRVRKITPYILDLPVSANDKHFSSSEGFRKNFRKLMEEFERECRRICREENVKFITTAPLPTDVFADHCHLFPKGNDIIARKVAEVISRDQLNPDDPDEK